MAYQHHPYETLLASMVARMPVKDVQPYVTALENYLGEIFPSELRLHKYLFRLESRTYSDIPTFIERARCINELRGRAHLNCLVKPFIVDQQQTVSWWAD